MWGCIEFAYRSFALAQLLTATCSPNSYLLPPYQSCPPITGASKRKLLVATAGPYPVPRRFFFWLHRASGALITGWGKSACNPRITFPSKITPTNSWCP
ncbi:hypothetical protein BJX68DRAFT_234697 [Aspergillus pseudodeflectus]|uniref:Secreted protein n=1 Tax=Aspergillus pseudodeflectus TaxID=176178 RepID=A0ABR4KKE1_9EURO